MYSFSTTRHENPGKIPFARSYLQAESISLFFSFHAEILVLDSSKSYNNVYFDEMIFAKTPEM